jgi:hypothetical protein
MAQTFAKRGVTDIATSIQDDGACLFICGIRLQWQFKNEACGVPARHSSRTTRRHVFKGRVGIAVPGDALQTRGVIAAARRAFRSLVRSLAP